jgi:plasmid stability protein
MPTLYVENVPADLYAALRKRATERRTSMSAEVLDLLRRSVPTPKEIARRRALMNRMLRISSRDRPRRGTFPSAEEMLREDRSR